MSIDVYLTELSDPPRENGIIHRKIKTKVSIGKYSIRKPTTNWVSVILPFSSIRLFYTHESSDIFVLAFYYYES